jgi:hypothetical protein
MTAKRERKQQVPVCGGKPRCARNDRERRDGLGREAVSVMVTELTNGLNWLNQFKQNAKLILIVRSALK